MDKGKTIKSVTFQNINKCQDVVCALILKTTLGTLQEIYFQYKTGFC